MSVQVIPGDDIAEKGTAIVTVSPVDDNGTALTFAQLTNPEWQLMNTDGTVINDRTFENATIFMDPNDIVPKLGRFTFGHPICNWLYLPDDFPGIKISDHFMDHVNEFIDKAYAPTWCDIN